ncbi:MAG: addiction module protein [Pirellulales bacterium]|nr:addiction module protein [Pirellulales bacterium]
MAIKLEAADIERLSVAERLELIERLWESLPEAILPGEIPDWHLAEIAKRRAELDANPQSGRPWREVLDQLRGKG